MGATQPTCKPHKSLINLSSTHQGFSIVINAQWQRHSLQPPVTPHRMNSDELQKCRLVADPNVQKVLNHFYVRVCNLGGTCGAHNSMISQITVMIGWQKTRFQRKLIWWPGTGDGRARRRSWNFYWWELVGLDGRVNSNACLLGFFGVNDLSDIFQSRPNPEPNSVLWVLSPQSTKVSKPHNSNIKQHDTIQFNEEMIL